MLTETVVLDNVDSTWKAIVNTTNTLTIASVTDDIRIRFGIDSVSEGIKITEQDIVTAKETMYVKPAKRKKTGHIVVYINRA